MRCCLVASPAPLLAWWNDAWGVRVKVTFDNSAHAENLVNFPVLIRLDSSRVKYFRTQDAGQDIRFVDADDTTVLAHEIEAWNEAGSSYVWVRVPQVDASSSTDFIWMYYGNVNAADGEDATGVWNANYRGVSASPREPRGHVAPDDGQHVQRQPRHDLGRDDGRAAGARADRGCPQLRRDGRLRLGLDPRRAHPVHVRGVDQPQHRPQPGAPHRHLANTQFFVEDNDLLEAGTTTEFNIDGPTSILPNAWYHAAFVQRATGWTIYLNGAVEASGANTTSPGTGFYIGVYPVPASGGEFPGLIDEARISDTPRSAAWIAAQYESMSDTFATYTAPEAGPCCQPLTTTRVGGNVPPWGRSRHTISISIDHIGCLVNQVA